MDLLQTFLQHPRKLWIRRVNFQVHLWAGILLAAYVIVIGVTGSILVFGAELARLENPSRWPSISLDQPVADIAIVIDNLRVRYPHTHIVSITAPSLTEPVFMAIMQSQERIAVACHAISGQVLGEVHSRRSRLEWIYDLHENLLARRTGRVVNGSAAGLLVLLAITGLVNWWPGARNWRRGLTVDVRRRWRRINFDLHSAVGFWGFGFVLLWAITGIYFAWPDKVSGLINRVSPIVNSRPPMVVVDQDSEMKKLDFHSMLAKAHAVDPGTTWKALMFPSSRRSAFEMLMSRSPGIGRDYEDTLYFNPYNGEYISNWRYGVNRSLGDWLIWLQIPLHFGTHWGLGIKCVWASAGLALPLLSVSGLIMYWNRMLRKWRSELRKS